MSNDLPAGYRWATEDETEQHNATGLPGAIVVPRTADSSGAPYTQDEADVAVPTAPKVQIIHSRDPDSECDLTVFVNGVKVNFTEEDIDPGRGYDEESIQERRDEAEARASRPDATEFDKAVAAALDAARFERFAL